MSSVECCCPCEPVEISGSLAAPVAVPNFWRPQASPVSVVAVAIQGNVYFKLKAWASCTHEGQDFLWARAYPRVQHIGSAACVSGLARSGRGGGGELLTYFHAAKYVSTTFCVQNQIHMVQALYYH